MRGEDEVARFEAGPFACSLHPAYDLVTELDREWQRPGHGRQRNGGQISFAAIDVHLAAGADHRMDGADTRSEEHTSELQSLMRISYAVFCLKKKKTHRNDTQSSN